MYSTCKSIVLLISSVISEFPVYTDPLYTDFTVYMYVKFCDQHQGLPLLLQALLLALCFLILFAGVSQPSPKDESIISLLLIWGLNLNYAKTFQIPTSYFWLIHA